VCERSKVGYAIGYSRNAVTARKIANLLELARLQFCKTGEKARAAAVFTPASSAAIIGSSFGQDFSSGRSIADFF
jgi:hypothetical protein